MFLSALPRAAAVFLPTSATQLIWDRVTTLDTRLTAETVWGKRQTHEQNSALTEGASPRTVRDPARTTRASGVHRAAMRVFLEEGGARYR